MIFSDLDAVTEWLYSHVRVDAPRGVDALDAARELFAALGDPQDDCPAIHIVGTAGKGSVGAFITAALVGAGERVVTHQSPHVYDIRERFLLDGGLPSEAIVTRAAGDVAQAAAECSERPTFFALTTALAAVIGRHERVDRLVVEAGIGGRVDATNVFSRHDVVTVITAIGLDHTDVLGSTVTEIAAEKAAVLAGRKLAIMAPQSHLNAARVVRDAAEAAGVELREVDADGDWRELARATAVAAVGDRAHVPESVALPGRYERQDWAGRTVVFDGAHNPMKLRGLADALARDGHERVAAVVALGVGKDLAESAAVIAEFAEWCIVTTFGPTDGSFGPRGTDPAVLVDALQAAGVASVTLAGDDDVTGLVPDEADVIVVTGSFLHLATLHPRFSGT